MAELDRINRSCRKTLDVFALLNQPPDKPQPPGLPLPALMFDGHTISQSLPYPRKLGPPPCALWPENLDAPMLWFFHHHPEYRYYWLTEYDVRFSGEWPWFFSQFQNNKSDLLATTIFDYDFRPCWAHWRSFSSPREVSLNERTRATLSFYRLSRVALQALDAAYRNGCKGHYEVTIPTILKQGGLVLEDIGGDGAYVPPENRNRFYLNRPGVPGLAPGTFVLHEEGRLKCDLPNMLWNPFKD